MGPCAGENFAHSDDTARGCSARAPGACGYCNEAMNGMHGRRSTCAQSCVGVIGGVCTREELTDERCSESLTTRAGSTGACTMWTARPSVHTLVHARTSPGHSHSYPRR